MFGKHRSAVAFILILGGFFTPGVGWGKKSDIGAKPKFKPLKERTDYEACRKTALEQAARFPDSKSTKIKRLLAECRERHPAVAEFISCKKNALKSSKGDKEELKRSLSQCQSRYEKLAFDPQNLVPFLKQNDEVFFAGAGLNLPRKLNLPADLSGDSSEYPNDFGNFNCAPMVDAFLNKKSPEYLLFGNDPRAFQPWSHLSAEAMRAKIKFINKPDKDFIHPLLGQVVQLGHDVNRLANYFPVSYCYFERRLGSLYDGIKIYYLMDHTKRMASPYFGIAFYRDEAQLPPQGKIVGQVLQRLGPGYQPFKLKGDTTFIAKEAFKSFDEEGDPRNLCAPPRNQELIAILKSDATTGKPQYLILANGMNLCKFGDRILNRTAD